MSTEFSEVVAMHSVSSINTRPKGGASSLMQNTEYKILLQCLDNCEFLTLSMFRCRAAVQINV